MLNLVYTRANTHEHKIKYNRAMNSQIMQNCKNTNYNYTFVATTMYQIMVYLKYKLLLIYITFFKSIP